MFGIKFVKVQEYKKMERQLDALKNLNKEYETNLTKVEKDNSGLREQLAKEMDKVSTLRGQCADKESYIKELKRKLRRRRPKFEDWFRLVEDNDRCSVCDKEDKRKECRKYTFGERTICVVPTD